MPAPTGNTTLAALIKLLDEPDEHAFSLVREQLFSVGTDALEPLERTLENTFDPLVQERIRYIVEKLNSENLYVDFVNWLNLGSDDLLKGFILVTRTQFPSLDETDIIVQIEQIKMDIWLELHENLTAMENIRVMNHILFDLHNFDGNKSEMAAPQNSYINTFLESRKGSPLSLGILFIILAQKLGLPVYGVNLPQHFILAYLTEPGLENPGEDDVLFYVNPFNRGTVFTRREIELFIKQMKIKPETSFFAPCTNADIIRRLIDNLIFSYNQEGSPEKIENLEHLLTAFE
ncbi:MAG: transglutaminase-like domain-containing protein [Bacteroidota bacterium]